MVNPRLSIVMERSRPHLQVESGTPQGAALSPFYFSIFIFGAGEGIEKMSKEKGGELIEEDLEHLWSLLFADDNKLAGVVKNNADR